MVVMEKWCVIFIAISFDAVITIIVVLNDNGVDWRWWTRHLLLIWVVILGFYMCFSAVVVEGDSRGKGGCMAIITLMKSAA